MNDFLGIGIVGVAGTLIVELIKAKFPNNPVSSKFVMLLVAILAGVGYTLVKDTPYYQSILGVLMTSTTIWAFLLNKNEKPQKEFPPLG